MILHHQTHTYYTMNHTYTQPDSIIHMILPPLWRWAMTGGDSLHLTAVVMDPLVVLSQTKHTHTHDIHSSRRSTHTHTRVF